MLVVLVVGDLATTLVDVLAAELYGRYGLPTRSLEVHCLGPADYMLVFADEATAIVVYNEGRPLQFLGVSLHLRWWSSFSKATGVTLPDLVDVELRGVPAHAWELKTAEHLLDEWCWIRNVHPDTIVRWDYSVFSVFAWSLRPESIPAAIDLVISEPPVMVEEVPPVKWALEYPNEVTVLPVEMSPPPPIAPPPRPPPPSAGRDDEGGNRRRRRQASSLRAHHLRI